MSDTEVTQSNFDTTTQYTGRVKWFNNKAGYGFVTVVKSADDSKVGEDVFCHHSGVNVASEQYKYLVQGEYVEFTLRSSDNDNHPYQAASLTGMCGGKLMCETRNEQRLQRLQDENNGSQEGAPRQARQGRRRQRGNYSRERINVRGQGPREGETWTLVRESNTKRENQYAEQS
tara:strand:- start:1741 stop:2262 length:522 start_codon:yes stop_codon:yes gene_type:complete